MNDSRRTQIAKQHLILLKLITKLDDIHEDERWAIDEIKSEQRKEEAEEGNDKLEDLIDLLKDAAELFEEAAQGNYSKILAKQQKEAEKQSNQPAVVKQQQEDKIKRFNDLEIAAFIQTGKPYSNPNNWPVNELDEFYEWKYREAGQYPNGDPILGPTEDYQKFIKSIAKPQFDCWPTPDGMNIVWE